MVGQAIAIEFLLPFIQRVVDKDIALLHFLHDLFRLQFLSKKFLSDLKRKLLTAYICGLLVFLVHIVGGGVLHRAGAIYFADLVLAG